MRKWYDAMVSRLLYSMHSRPFLKAVGQALYLMGMFVSLMFRTFLNPAAQVRFVERLTEPVMRLSDRLLDPLFRLIDPVVRVAEWGFTWLLVKLSFIWQPFMQLVGIGIKRLTTLF